MTNSRIYKSLIKYKIVFLLMYIMCFNAYASEATTTETLEWLKENINRTGYRIYNSRSDTWRIVSHKMTYDNKEIRIEYERTDEEDDGDVSRWAFLYIIPIKEIAKIETTTGHQMFFHRDVVKDRISEVTIKSASNTHDPFSKCYLEDGSLSEMESKVSFWFLYDKELAQRIKNAFEHLIELKKQEEPF